MRLNDLHDKHRPIQYWANRSSHERQFEMEIPTGAGQAITTVPWQTVTLERAVRVGTTRVVVAVVCFQTAFVDICHSKVTLQINFEIARIKKIELQNYHYQ